MSGGRFDNTGITEDDLRRVVGAVDALVKSEGQGEEPEAYLNQIIELLDGTGHAIVSAVLRNLEVWFGHALVKAGQARLALTQAQIDELTELVNAHFRTAARDLALGDWATLAETERRWKEMGLVAPTARLQPILRDALLAGRLYESITNATSFQKMRRLAESLPRLPASQEVALREASNYFLKPVAGLAQDVALALDRANTRAVVGGNTSVDGWRAVAREIRELTRGDAFARDWHRVAATETRYALETGRLVELRRRGVSFVSVLVQGDACERCREMFLQDGRPRRFSTEEYAANASAFPLNVGLRRADWRPTVPAHPWCRCTLYPAEHLDQIMAVTA